jgi:hypothetical protein
MKRNKLFISIIIFLAVAVAAISSDMFIDYFTAESNGDSVSVKWNSSSEDGLKRFELERSISSAAFKKIYTTNVKGMPSSYSYNDTEAFMKQDASENNELLTQNTYNYRLKLVFSDNTFTYSEVALVKHKPSSIRRTWGMIKEMFR